MRSAPALLAAALLAAAGGCRRSATVFPRAPVVVISIDTLRADHLPAYGYSGVETPGLDALARDSVVFENAVAQAPLTLPSHVTLFTGLNPFQHGVRDNSGYRLGKDKTTLAAFLKARGYAAGGAVSAIVLDHSSGVARGFDFWEDGVESRDASETLGRVQRAGSETEKLLEEWIATLPADKPFFAFLHLYEPHTPYEPPEPFRARYAGKPYDGEIAAADAVVGSFVNWLKRKALYDRALVLLLSDHGEGLGEHGEDEHGILLYRETTHVPLFVKLPGQKQAGRRESAPAALADVFPTVALLSGARAPENLAGRALLDAGSPLPAQRRVYSETLYPRFHLGWSDLAALTDDRYEYIEAPRPELYDWRDDPQEKRDLAPGMPAAFRSMRVELAALDRPLQAPGQSDPETLSKLASLGYISATRTNLDEKNLPDPKDRLPTLELLKQASRLSSQHREDEAIVSLKKLARENPRMLDAWETLARIARRAGRPREALAALEAADRLSPATPQILLGLADLHRELRQFDKARSLALAAAQAGASGHHEALAAIALDKGDLETARAETLTALSQSKSRRGPWVLLARVEVQRGDLAAALAATDRALSIERERKEPPMINLQATRGDVLARMGREKEAEVTLRAETRDFPGNVEGWSRLALLYASSGRANDFRDTVLALTRQVPTPAGFEAAARVCEAVGDAAGARLWRARKAGRAAGPS
ncbi:MAG: sulfatase-like hydrolase/transferase [Thermoanaerobaculia bacterium]